MRIFTTTAALAFAVSSFALPGPVLAQDALSSCDPNTGRTPSGAQCVTLTPVDPTRYQTQINAEGASRYRPVNVGELVETYECNPSGGGTGYGAGGSILIEDCGEALALDPATFKEFVGYSGAPAPAPAPVYTAPPAPVYTAPPAPVYAAPVTPVAPPVYVAPPLPPVYAAPILPATGMGNVGLVAVGLGAAAALGIAALALSDSSSTSSTN